VLILQELGGEDFFGRHDDDDDAAVSAAVSSHKLSAEWNSAAFGAGYQRIRLASSGTRRPPHRAGGLYPCPRLQRCSSERAPNDCAGGGVGFAAGEYRSCAELGYSGNLKTRLSASVSSSHHHPPLFRLRRSAASHRLTSTTTGVGPLQRKDIFYSGSVLSLRSSAAPIPAAAGLHSQPNVELAGSAVHETAAESVEEETAAATGKSRRDGAVFSTLLVMLDVSLLRNCSFLVVCASSVFVQLGYFVPVVFLTPYAQTLQLTTSDAALFLSVMGPSSRLPNDCYNYDATSIRHRSTLIRRPFDCDSTSNDSRIQVESSL